MSVSLEEGIESSNLYMINAHLFLFLMINSLFCSIALKRGINPSFINLSRLHSSNRDIGLGDVFILRFHGGSSGTESDAGSGSVLYKNSVDNEIWSSFNYYGPNKSKNYAEYRGLIEGLKYIRANNLNNIAVESSSSLLEKQISGTWKVKSDVLIPLHEETVNLMHEIKNIKFQYIDKKENSRADNLSYEAITTRLSSNEKLNNKDIMPVQNYSELGNVWILRFDGGSRGNPGIAGSGSVLYKNTVGNEVWSSYNYLGNDKTNNYAEYMGLIEGLKWIEKKKLNNIVIEGDSDLVIKQMSGIYKVKSANLMQLNQEALKLIKNIKDIKLRHIPREENSRADHLSNLAMDYRKSVASAVDEA